ncbi:MAG TPA: HAMP domain-containing sensor histidine kinase [Polyangiaceae bacterium]|jgi:signal transduction histidine kinase
MTNAKMRELQARARFEALRKRVFDEMGRTSTRARLAWIIPFHLLVISVLVVRGESTTRAIVQVGVVMALGVIHARRIASDDWRLRIGCFVASVFGYLIMLGTTGGLASPLLVCGAVMMAAVALKLPDPPWLRKVIFGLLLCGFVVLGVLSRTSVGLAAVPLFVAGAQPTPEYIAVALLAAVFAMTGVYGIGCAMTRGYERAAVELASRREELCSVNEDRTRALEGLAARLAHEVKNPLAAIKGLSSHMARTAADARTAERLAIVAAEADRLQAIVDGFLTFSRGLDELETGPVNPYDVAHELTVLLETRAAEAEVALEVSGERMLALEADARKLRQALLNVVLNAIQASPKGAIVKVAVGADCGGARIAVQDDGVGMTPEVMERIRRPYFTTKEGGTGIGVAVARGLVEQHGGRIEFKSAPGRGTTVVLSLPMKAKLCARLPNPLRPPKPEGEADASEPAIAGAR